MIPVEGAGLQELVRIALTASAREYPHLLVQVLGGDEDLRPPRMLNPSFYGSYDWHSAVHNHWLLVRALQRGVGALEGEVVARLDEHLSAERLAAELAFFSGPGGRTVERPYGWAWLVLLHAECAAAAGHGARQRGSAAALAPPARRWAEALSPLARLLDERLADYFGGGLAFPIRTGTHGNTAFSLQLTLRAARCRGDHRRAAALADDARRMFAGDEWLPWSDDPAGDAFLDPPLAEADLLADVLSPGELAVWLERSLPEPARTAWDPPAFAPDGEDPGTVHLEGLLLTRAWALAALGRALPEGHPAVGRALDASRAHITRARKLRPGDGFNRAHWLPTFLLLLDERLAVGGRDRLLPGHSRMHR